MSLQIEQLALRCSDCGMLMEIPMRFHRLADELLEFCQNEEETHSIICKPTVLPASSVRATNSGGHLKSRAGCSQPRA